MAKLDWQSPDFAGATRGYDIEIGGGVHSATIGELPRRSEPISAEPIPAASAF